MEAGAGTQWDRELIRAWLEIVRTGAHEHKDFELPSEKVLLFSP
jgi:hypothetical protein